MTKRLVTSQFSWDVFLQKCVTTINSLKNRERHKILCDLEQSGSFGQPPIKEVDETLDIGQGSLSSPPIYLLYFSTVNCNWCRENLYESLHEYLGQECSPVKLFKHDLSET